MKNKTRKIHVDGNDYIWICSEVLWPVHLLRVWCAGQKKAPWFEVEFEVPVVVTPKIVAETIKKVELRKGRPVTVDSTVTLKWNSAEQCVAI